jgi:NitT/TauT family transport system ATP-binding protein
VPVNLPAPRDQIGTKELPEFVRLRSEVSRLVRSRDKAEDASGTATKDADAPATEQEMPAPAGKDHA